jgi:UDP-GlcNAc:undecaprenyl-phosphate GlcNAc-1-phosphate transferase
MFIELSFFFAASFIISAAAFPYLIRRSVRAGFVDRPEGRKKHERNVPPIGGLVIFPVFMAVSLVYLLINDLPLYRYLVLFSALTLILITGAIDDKHLMPAKIKLAIQFVAALIIVLFGSAQFWSLGNLFGFGDIALGFMLVPFCVFCTVLLINAINLMDGIDGLSGGNGFVIFFWLCVCAIYSGLWEYLGFMAIFMGSVAGFLRYNLRNPFSDRLGRRKATVFLGDSGSMAMGLLMAWCALRMGKVAPPEIYPITIAWILSLPIMDACAQFIRRIAHKKHPFSADNEHFHHHFVESGISVANSTAIIVFISFILGFFGYIGSRFGVSEPIMSYLWVFLLIFHVYMSMKPERYRKIIAHYSSDAVCKGQE